ncbi:MAG: hypothetical protein A3I39_00805 [Candidatus Yanofskybacteria bacterium RIFCSPLOWO2_02_FULL_47_9b]|uniref:HicB-like antitoxin of toxin-antitoxin system domain-containing protein n=1 Tax=Candidatus Yanofskybacteria bacterium RIFCSPLOWO2_02_FULL_47_9b TaxID=1802708 RepID=A0A1F8H7U6_9BACT|nr:MAG: hypothetical protein A3I39_00805 [Candidatus Yanofskybacteria bacterium RIFCSPLOWO2_02_FULL_47_9b]
MRKTNKKNLTLSVIYEAALEGGYIAFVPSLPGCHTQGDNLKETKKNVKEAISLYLESLQRHNEPLPKDTRILQGKVQVFV